MPDNETNGTARIKFLPEKGERAFIVGQTGSGKTAFAVFMLKRMKDSPIVIYDTKDEPKFAAMENCRTVYSFDDIHETMADGEVDYIIYKPDIEIVASPAALDALLYRHYDELKGTDLYIDELYNFHNSGRAGKGLVALLTRGRSRGITCIMSSQQPKWVSTFALSEAQKFYIFDLINKDNRKRIEDIIPGFSEQPRPPKHGFYFYETGLDQPIKFRPIKLDAEQNQGYVDNDAAEPSANDVALSGILWV